ncbi:MAG TPA: DUF4395 family protein [Candidatus Acidoferrales bacterium]
MTSSVEHRFMQQQGFLDADGPACAAHFRALRFQPSIVGPLILLGIILQSRFVFAALSALLWFGVALPRWNVFEALYNALVAEPMKRQKLTPAPAPRRFAQGMAATFMLVVAVALSMGWYWTGVVFEAFIVIAFLALLFGKFCLGSYIYHLIRGRSELANATLPWSKS